mmetsp:Transcript_32852/g.45842  ORF Transcript_32852/g.45842 Transcript_32852/m.45842 type:complete len:82 (-) Transcript_32852:110-355(-)
MTHIFIARGLDLNACDILFADNASLYNSSTFSASIFSGAVLQANIGVGFASWAGRFVILHFPKEHKLYSKPLIWRPITLVV